MVLVFMLWVFGLAIAGAFVIAMLKVALESIRGPRLSKIEQENAARDAREQAQRDLQDQQRRAASAAQDEYYGNLLAAVRGGDVEALKNIGAPPAS